MTAAAGIDLGSTTTKAVIVDENGTIVGQGITNSRSSYEVACAVALEEARLGAALTRMGSEPRIREATRLALHRRQLAALRTEIESAADPELEGPARQILDEMEA